MAYDKEDNNITPINEVPHSIAKVMHLDHLGIILSRLAILGALFIIFGTVGG